MMTVNDAPLKRPRHATSGAMVAKAASKSRALNAQDTVRTFSGRRRGVGCRIAADGGRRVIDRSPLTSAGASSATAKNPGETKGSPHRGLVQTDTPQPI